MDLFPKDYKKNNLAMPGASITPAGSSLRRLKDKLSGGGLGFSSSPKTVDAILRGVKILSMIILALVLLLWGALYFYQRSLNSQIKELEKMYSEVFNEKDKKLAAEIFDFDQGALLIESLLKSHVYASKAFEQLATSTMPRVQWQDFNLSIEDSRITAKGIASNYATLARQVLALEKGGFSKIEISGISLDKVGGVSFGAQFNFDPKILQKQ